MARVHSNVNLMATKNSNVVQAGTKFECIRYLVQNTAFSTITIPEGAISVNLSSTATFYLSDTGTTTVESASQTTGSGLDDMTSGGTFTSVTVNEYKVVLDATGTPDTFEWFKDGASQAAGVAITGAAQTLDNGVTVTFAATTGHTLNDAWTFQAYEDSIGDTNINIDIANTVSIYVKGSAANQEIEILYNKGI